VTSVSFHVSDAELSRTFTVNTLTRGRDYARRRKIVDYAWSKDARTLSGTCGGSRGQHYRLHVRFRDGPAPSRIVHTVCTCPMQTQCKHVAALLIVAARQSPPVAVPHTAAIPGLPPVPAEPSSPPTWRSTIAAIVDDTATTSSAPAVKPLALAVGFTAQTTYSPHRQLTLRPMIAGARENWIRTGASWRDIVGPQHGPADPAHLAALRAIHRVLAGITYGTQGEHLPVVSPPPTFWQLLAEAVADGVTLIADHNLPATTLRLGRAALHYSITAHPDGARLATELVVDGTPFDPSAVEYIGAPQPHGLWYLADDVLTLAPLDHPVAGGELAALRSGADIVIPTADLPEFSLEALPNLTSRRTVRVDDGLLTPPTIEGPEAVLTLTDAPTGGRYYWSIGYRVNDANVVFDPAQPPGATPYRDVTAERDLWDRVLPQMRTLAARSGNWRSQAIMGLLNEIQRQPTDDLRDAHHRLRDTDTLDDAVSEATFPALRQAITLSLPEVAVICGELLPQLRAHPDIRVDYRCADEFRPAEHTPQIAFSADDDTGNDWFGLAVTVTVGDVAVPIADLIAELSSGATHMLLPDNKYFALDTPELRTLADLLAEARALGEIDSGRVSKHSLNATFWEELLALGVVDRQLAQWRKRMAQLAKATPPRAVKPSRRLKAELRDYQQDGLNWLTFLWKNGLGGILADDMGLGKTVQTLALVARAADADRHTRFLVVAPTSVVPNWVAECRKFVPGLRVSAITATEGRTGIPIDQQVDGANIVVTSYTLLRLLFDDFDRVSWNGAIFDEAQFIKNHTGKTHQCARRLEAPFKLAITGTPMENNLMELWSLLSVAAPGLFASPTAFTDYFRKPIESRSAPERLDTLRRRIKPVMLRRTKSQVAIDLPPKQEQSMMLDLSAKHRKIYDTRLARERQKVLGLLGDWEKNRFQVFRSLSMLRQLSLHAALVDSSHNSVTSAKVDYLADQLPALVDEGHSALVFSQFTSFLDIVRDQLDELGITYSYLDGSMSAKQRDTAIRRFTSGVNQVFLISLKAGGFGLNLTEADYCFVCDPWWNPAAESQAVDRAHRLGQQRPVNVYRLVSADTIEERVVRLQDRKRALFDAVVDDGELFGTALSADDIREMLA
jgi:superfamily II DNA or RNA helicase